jgi:tRNA (guanine-N7-)-methyltransferase
MRRRRRKGVFEKLEAYKAIYLSQEGFNVSALDNRMTSKSIVLELGCGRGQFLTEYAKRHPDDLCIGIELKEEVIIKACEKATAHQLDNALFVLGDGERLIDAFREYPIDVLFIHFCDPWPKERHAKRRLLHGRLLKQYAEAMKPNAVLRFKTDNKALFDFALDELKSSPFTILSIAEDIETHEAWQDNIMTEYESRFRALGQPIYGVVALRK